MFILHLALIAFVLLVIYWFLTKPKNMPPGPMGVPILGNLPALLWYGGSRHRYFNKLSETYGNVFTLRLGFNPQVVLNDMAAVREGFVHQGNALSGRPFPVVTRFVTNFKGILTTEGPNQREHRRFILHALRDLGFGRTQMQSSVLEEVQSVCDSFTEEKQQPIDITHIVGESVMSNVIHIMFGLKLTKDKVQFILNQLDNVSTIPSTLLLANTSSIATMLCELEIFRTLFGVQAFFNIRIPLQNLLKEMIVLQKQQLNDSDEGDNFIQKYILEQRKHESGNDAYWWDDDQLMHASVEMLVAGTDTTKMTITWGCLLLAMHPDVQEEVFQEIKRVIGTERFATMHDQPQLPVCEAVVLEILRYSLLVPTGVPHRALETSKLFDYTIPKGTSLVPNLYAISRDSKVFCNPNTFDPFRHFMNATRTTVINREQFIPFSVGRRSCIGESLARMEVFLYLIGLAQRFQIRLPAGVECDGEAFENLFRVPPMKTFIFAPRT